MNQEKNLTIVRTRNNKTSIIEEIEKLLFVKILNFEKTKNDGNTSIIVEKAIPKNTKYILFNIDRPLMLFSSGLTKSYAISVYKFVNTYGVKS